MRDDAYLSRALLRCNCNTRSVPGLNRSLRFFYWRRVLLRFQRFFHHRFPL